MKNHRLMWLILATISLLASVCTSHESNYVVAPANDGCVDELEECHHLSYYTSQSNVYFTSDTTLTFLPGTHILDHDGPVVISDVSNLTLQGDGEIQDGFHWTVKQSTVVIDCNGTNSGFLFRNFDDVTISGLTITNCGFNLTRRFISYIESNYLTGLFNWDFSLSLKAFYSLLALNGTNLLVEESSVQNGTGYGLIIVNVFNIEIALSWFYRNNIQCVGVDDFGGNVKILYLFSTSCPSPSPISNMIIIKDVSMSFGKNCGRSSSLQYQYVYSTQGFDVYRCGGLGINVYNVTCIGRPSVLLDDVRLIGNTAETGSNLLYTGIPLAVTINKLNCSEGQAYLFSSGLLFLSTHTLSIEQAIELRITNSLFIDNHVNRKVAGTGTGLFLFSVAEMYREIILSGCLFAGNEGVSIVRFEKANRLLPQVLQVNLIDVTIRGSTGFNPAGTYDYAGALVLVLSRCYANGLNVVDTPFTGIHLVHSFLTFGGINLVQNNSFKNGGGMVLNGLSNILFLSPTTVSFISNHADDFGGGIYISDDSFQNYFGACFYQVHISPGYSVNNITIHAINNTAGTTGAFLNGGNLDSCYYNGLESFSEEKLFSGITGLDFLSQFIEPKTFIDKSSFVSQTPVSVAICNSEGGYNLGNRIIQDPPMQFIPGKEFNISLVAIDNRNDKSNGQVIITSFNCTESISDCLDNDPFQELSILSSSECMNVSTVLRANEFTKLILIRYSTYIQIPYDLFPFLYIVFEPAKCPPGFKKEDVCVCNEFIESLEGVTCDINTTTITTTGSNIWIGYDNTTNATLYSTYCPQGYCIDGSVTFNILDSPDRQCAYHRSGILCGGCADGYSLLLGSNECGKCPNNNYLSLLLVFGVAGIALVVVLILLNLTVSVGTINGLIFYANIVKMNEKVFLPFGPSSPKILRQFISFLNLDFGLKTCFFNGLTEYSKTWLQFAFPFYIWLIMISIMLLSRRSTKISKLLGNNAIKVFATLLLLSYTKIIRVIGQILSLQRIHSNDTYYFVWRYDGTIHFNSLKFIILYCFALLVMIGLVVPYTLFLISLPFIDKCFAKIRCNFLLLKPFADAYAGPFNNKYQFWIGLLLVYRLFITIIIGASVNKDNSLYTNVVFVILLLNFLVNIKGLYNKAYLNFLESWFLSNVLILSVVALSYNQNVVQIGSIISVSLVMISFIGICTFHIFTKTWNRFCCKKSKDKPVSVPTNGSVDEDSPRYIDRGKSVFTSYNDKDLREPFLELINESQII